MRFKWTRYSEMCIGIAVQDVNQLALFYCADQHGTAFRVRGQVLAGHNAAISRSPERLFMYFFKLIQRTIVLEHNNTPCIAAQNQVVF